MRFSIDHVIEFIDYTVFNPVLAALIPIGLQFGTVNRILLHRTPGRLFPFAIDRIPSAQKAALGFVAFAACLRLNHLLSRRAINNGIPRSRTKFDPPNEIVLVTGGAGGFGAEAVKKFAAAGSKVIVLDVLDLTYPKPPNVFYFQVDLTDYGALSRVAEAIRQDVGEPTAVIANAGIARGKPVLEAKNSDIEVTFKVNVLAVFWTAKVFLPDMVKKNRGHFLITASTTAYLTSAGITDYSASKAAALAIYEGLQTELRHQGKAPAVRVSVICPAVARTRMFETVHGPSNFFFSFLEPQDVANRMFEIISSGYSQQVQLPVFGAMFAFLVRILPPWYRVAMQDVTAHAVDDLKPHDPLAGKA